MLKLSKLYRLGVLFAVTSWASVSTAAGNDNQVDKNSLVYPTMAVPLQSSFENEAQIAKLSQLLLNQNLTEDDRAKVFYERGYYYDNLGLKDLARLDFGQSLKINPAQPAIFNRLGMYFTQVGEYDAAYEAFDSTLELDPNNQDAIRNRAIALYYGDRINLALEDMQTYYQKDPNDPFRSLWLFIVEREVDEKAALKRLATKYHKRTTDNWNWVLVGIMLGEISEEQAYSIVSSQTRDNVLMAQRLTEAYFYLGKYRKAHGDYSDALSLYKLAISFNVYDYVEHGYSFLELGRIFNEYKKAQQSGRVDDFVKVN
ncbi:lipoprotein NlpI [Vibrio albus]|uniref:Lipoprotein NlpI n=1 Tax=Vibrio albus TaxID=2200953 RepID=A0A2U3B910_9VIBR|nr:lipoprotein NlpI [Vibrio albus]PWI33280.1 lipoprotein NlpI [Vibrio albus]